MGDSNSERNAVEVLAEEFLARYRNGDGPTLSDYLQRYPELADEIRDLFPALMMMEHVKPVDNNGASADKHRFIALKFDQLGDYHIIREVGRGGMGIVYEAEQISLGRRVALKVLPEQVLRDSKQKLRFEREAKAAARLHHTNIVPVFGVGEQDGTHYYVMQFIQGLGLDQVLEELRQLHGNQSVSGKPGTAEGEFNVSHRAHLTAADLAGSLMRGAFERTVIGQSDPDEMKGWRGQARGLGAEGGDRNEGGGWTGRMAQIEGLSLNPPDASTLAQTSLEQFTARPDTATGRLSDSSILSRSAVLPGQSGTMSGKIRKPTYWQSVANIGVQVASALMYAHDQGVLHRDIKPSNLLLDLRGTAWITDFGLAKASDQQDITHTGDILGTLRYMPPEAFEGKTDPRGDIYSLGLTLYELLVLKPAFAEDNRHKLIKLVTTADVVRLEKLNPEIPRDLITIVHKAIDADLEHRYQTAQALAEDLQRFIDDEPIKARRQSATEAAWRWARQHRAAITMVALLATALVVGTVVSTWQAFRAIRHEKLAQERLKQETAARDDAEVQRTEAVKMRNRAEANFEQARRAVDNMYTQVAEKWLATQPKMEGIQREFLTKALQFYTDFAQVTSSDTHVRLEVAKAFRRVAEIQHKLGNPAEAERAFQQAVDRLQALVNDFPHVPEYRQSLAEALNKLGALLGDTKRYAEEQPTRRCALKLLQSLATEFPKSPSYRRDLASGHFLSGSLLRALGNHLEAEQEYRQAIALQRDLVAEFPSEPVYRENLAASYSNLADTVHWLNRRGENLANLREALTLWESLVVDFPSVPTYRNGLGDTYHWLAVRLPLAEAEPTLRQAVSILEKLAAEFPAVTGYRYDLMRSYQYLGKILWSTGRSQQAIETLSMATVIGEKLVGDSPAMYYYAARLSRIYMALWRLFVAAGRVDEAQLSYDRAHSLMNRPDVTPEQLNDMAWMLATVADARILDAPRAVEMARKATELAPHVGTYWNTFGVSCYRAGDWRGAIAALEKSTQLRAGGDGHDWFFLAMARWQLGEKDQAMKWFHLADLWTAKYGSMNAELLRFRTEAATQLEVTEQGPEHVDDLAIGQALVDANPIASSYTYRGRNYAEADQLDRAEDDYASAIALGENELNPWCERALVRLAKDNVEGYKSDCAEIIQRFQQSDDAQSSAIQAWTCALAPNAMPDLSPALALAEKSVRSDPKSAFPSVALGAILYRLGRFNEAATKLDDANRAAQHIPGNGFPAIYSCFFLAMTHCRLQHREEAQKWFDRALENANQLREKYETGATKLPWDCQLTIKVLRKEIETQMSLHTKY